jgi:hypothetical protein
VVLIRALGHTGLDRAPVVFRTNEDGAQLARAVANALGRIGSPWELHIRQLPSGCVFLSELARTLDVIEVRDGGLRPTVELEGVQDPRDVLSRNLRRAENKARNRIARAGLAFEERWISDPEAIAARIPELRALHHARDLQLRGTSLLDDAWEGAYYDALVRGHLAQLEMFELRLSGELAAYVLSIRNGRVRSVLDNRVSPAWTAFSAGMIANNAALRAAALDPAVRVLDWGAGVQRYKLESATNVIAHHDLIAWSSPLVRRILAAGRRARRIVPRTRPRGTRPGGLQLALSGRTPAAAGESTGHDE